MSEFREGEEVIVKGDYKSEIGKIAVDYSGSSLYGFRNQNGNQYSVISTRIERYRCQECNSKKAYWDDKEKWACLFCTDE